MSETYRAIGQTAFGGPEVLHEVRLPVSSDLQGRDIAVQVKAVAINPVDTKVRAGRYASAGAPSEFLVTGWDASGVVLGMGPECDGSYREGDEVMFAGNIARPGANAELVLVDQFLISRKPRKISFAEAAALPLTALTAWEGLIEGCEIPPHPTGTEPLTALVVGGGGGVGSIAIQLLKRVCGLKVVATATRPETREFSTAMGADLVIDHREDLKTQLAAAGIAGVDYILDTADPNQNLPALISVLNPLGKICLILALHGQVDLTPLFLKRGSLVFEYMFARPLLGCDPDKQGIALNRIAGLVDRGTLQSTLTHSLPWSVENLQKVHGLIESGKAVGKIALTLE